MGGVSDIFSVCEQAYNPKERLNNGKNCRGNKQECNLMFDVFLTVHHSIDLFQLLIFIMTVKHNYLFINL